MITDQKSERQNTAASNENVEGLRIVIALCTCNRPKGLERVLQSLSELEMGDGLSVQTLVVDNSAEGNARTVVEKLRANVPWEVSYIHEVKSGISYARNAALEHVLPMPYDYMASIDDDMHVDPNWLTELMSVATETGDEAVIGCTLFDYSGDMSWWVEGAYRLDYREPENGSLLDQGHTGGSLIKLDCIRALKLRFDEDLGKSGGEDTLFFERILNHGGKIRCASGAISYEVLGADRMRVWWWLKRWYRTGNTTGLVALAASRKSRFRIFTDGVIRVGLGLMGTLVSLPWLLCRRTTGMRAVRTVCRGSGYIAAVVGLRFNEYAGGGRGE